MKKLSFENVGFNPRYPTLQVTTCAALFLDEIDITDEFSGRHPFFPCSVMPWLGPLTKHCFDLPPTIMKYVPLPLVPPNCQGTWLVFQDAEVSFSYASQNSFH